MALHPCPDAGFVPVRRRLVCYISGFDPQGPAHYHQLYKTESQLQSRVSGATVQVGKRRRVGEHIAAWDVRYERADVGTDVAYEYLRWDDIVRDHWPRSRLGLYRATVAGSWRMWRNGVMWHTWRRAWPMFVAIALPGVLMMAVLLLGLGLLATAAVMASAHSWGLASLVLLLTPPLLILAAIQGEQRSHMGWLMRSLACLGLQGRGQTPSLEARIDSFARHVAAAVAAGTFDEVLVVGHSSGAMLAVASLARALRQLPQDWEHSSPTRLGLMTLGHCSPLLSAQPEAAGYREEIRQLVENKSFCWVDFGAPPDGCCFALSDPSLGMVPDINGEGRPKLLNPRFAQLFTKERYKSIRSDKFRCHFQYLMAAELANGYDYFEITGGAMSLSERYAAQESVQNFRQFECFGGVKT